jgi:putative sterol carrier protein
MVDEELKEKVMGKIDDGSFGPDDLEDYMTLFLNVANESEDIQEEVSGWDRLFAFRLTGGDNFWLKVADGKFESAKGDIDNQDIILECTADTAAGIFTGEVDATSAYMSGDLKVNGPLPDAVKFRTITELVREELE